MATVAECPTGGIVVSDGTSAVPVCNGAQGPAGATGATGSGAPLDENAAIAAVSNLRVNIDGLPSFRPKAVSRLGFNVAVSSGGQVASIGQTSFPQKSRRQNSAKAFPR